MEVQIAALCDAATDYGGKLNLLGTFDTVVAPQLPAFHPQCSIALRIVFSRLEEGAHAVRLTLIDADGRSVMPPIDVKTEASFGPDASFISRNIIINIQNLKFDQPGQYSIEVAMDGRHSASIPLQVRLAASPASRGTPGQD